MSISSQVSTNKNTTSDGAEIKLIKECHDRVLRMRVQCASLQLALASHFMPDDEEALLALVNSDSLKYDEIYLLQSHNIDFVTLANEMFAKLADLKMPYIISNTQQHY